MSAWGADNFDGEGRVVLGINFSDVNSLSNAVAALPVAAKKAMYAAASARTIRRGTWNGCAFNAAGIEVGNSQIQSIAAAAKQFGCTYAVVQRFIRYWDSLQAVDNDEATGILREKLEEVGLFTEPADRIKVVSYSVWRDEQRAAVQDFVKELEENDFLCEGLAEANELLFANA